MPFNLNELRDSILNGDNSSNIVPKSNEDGQTILPPDTHPGLCEYLRHESIVNKVLKLDYKILTGSELDLLEELIGLTEFQQDFLKYSRQLTPAEMLINLAALRGRYDIFILNAYNSKQNLNIHGSQI